MKIDLMLPILRALVLRPTIRITTQNTFVYSRVVRVSF